MRGHRESNGPLHDPVTWFKITHAGEQVARWNFQNKGRSRWTGTSCFVLEVPLCNLLTGMCDFYVTGSCKGPILRRMDNAIHRINRRYVNCRPVFASAGLYIELSVIQTHHFFSFAPLLLII